MNLKQPDLSEETRLAEKQHGPKILAIKSTHFNRLMLFTAGLAALVIALAVTLLQLQKRQAAQRQENTQLVARVTELQAQAAQDADRLNLITASTDSNQTKALSYIEGIQAKLGKINSYLSRRGLHGLNFKAAKTAASKKASNLKLYARYNNYLEQLVTNIAMIPMGYPRISAFTSFFGYRSNPFDFGRNEFHPGIDFKGKTGDQVKCTASGRVIFTGRAGGYGNCIRIQHAGNLQTWYGHLSRISVREGQRVTAGDIIGRVGSTGRSTGPHLHYEVRKDGRAVNPKSYLTLN